MNLPRNAMVTPHDKRRGNDSRHQWPAVCSSRISELQVALLSGLVLHALQCAAMAMCRIASCPMSSPSACADANVQYWRPPVCLHACLISSVRSIFPLNCPAPLPAPSQLPSDLRSALLLSRDPHHRHATLPHHLSNDWSSSTTWQKRAVLEMSWKHKSQPRAKRPSSTCHCPSSLAR